MTKKALHSAGLILSLLVTPFGLSAANLYVSPTGTSSGPGTLSQPYSLYIALSGRVGHAGDTFWMRGGTYKLGHLDTTIHGASGYPITFRPVPGEKPRVDGSLTFFSSVGYVVLRDFELLSSDTNRVSSQTGVGYNPTDIKNYSGIFCFVPNMTFINLIVHDHVRHGFYLSENTYNNLVYGCVVYNNGWVGPDNSSGHNFYVQGNTGTKVLAENLAFNNAGLNFQVYESHSGSSLVGVTLEGNVAFNAGALETVRPYRDWLVGVDSPALKADNIVFKSNLGYRPTGVMTLPQVQIGRQNTNGRIFMQDNYLPLGLLFNNWTTATVSNNVFAPLTSDYQVNLQQTLTALTGYWNRNAYFRPSTGSDFRKNSSTYSFSNWKSATGYDSSSAETIGSMSGTKVFMRPNKYEPGRAHIVVYNWSSYSTVPVNVGSVLPLNTRFEVRNAQNYYAAPVLSGTYTGQVLNLPMYNLSVAKPNGALRTPPPTGPKFNLFVLVPLGSATSTFSVASVNTASATADPALESLEAPPSAPTALPGNEAVVIGSPVIDTQAPGTPAADQGVPAVDPGGPANNPRRPSIEPAVPTVSPAIPSVRSPTAPISPGASTNNPPVPAIEESATTPQVMSEGTNVVVYWPIAAGDLRLQSAEPGTSNWTNVTEAPVAFEDQNVVVLPGADVKRTYRLVKP